ncbi:CoA protein activase [Metallumcola ferriviriculae]|uniref:CoA protein activase n=1 Tax=Metallumcola ferriviriculae TaxID=3039180 RepID=A0AAU0UQE8_9FIRM|nr:CoA protein activase [Desulfitibacteraceae bacterium MK1]
MRVTFPHMGTSHIAFKHLINNLGHEAIVPPAPSKRTLSLGVRHAPEFACIPFKILLGSYIEALENGAEMIISSGGVGPCRAGIYGLLHEEILKDLGYDFEMLIFEPPLRGLLDFIKKIGRVIRPTRVSWPTFIKVFKTSWQKLIILDETEILSHQIRPYEVIRGETTRAFKEALTLIDKAETRQELDSAGQAAEMLLRDVTQDRSRKPLRIGLIGEIYVVLEPFINLDIEKTLGEMGVETHRSIYLTDWTRDNTVFDGEKDIKNAAKPYLNQLIGGHGINSVGETVLYASNGFDGVIQLAPFTCIPEIVAKSILNRVSRDLNIPVLTLFLDEQTGTAGAQTRLEAFTDLLLQKRRNKGDLDATGIFGN